MNTNSNVNRRFQNAYIIILIKMCSSGQNRVVTPCLDRLTKINLVLSKNHNRSN